MGRPGWPATSSSTATDQPHHPLSACPELSAKLRPNPDPPGGNGTLGNEAETTLEIELSSGSPADLYPTIGPSRGVVLLPDIEGRRPLFEDMAAGLCTTHNWNVMVLDPLEGYEHGLHPNSGPDPDERDDVVAHLDDDVVVSDIVDAANRLEVDPVAVIGFGIGGTYAMKAAAVHRFDRAVAFYGAIRLPSRWRGRGQREPIDLLALTERPENVLAVIGTDDPFIPGADVDELVRLGVRVARYERAGHGFAHIPDLVKQRPKYAADAWAQVVSHLAVDG